MRLRWATLALLVTLTTGCDLWTKRWAAEHLSTRVEHPPRVCAPRPDGGPWGDQRLPSRTVTVVPGYLDLRYAENCGGAWSLFSGLGGRARVPLFSLIGALALAFVVVQYRRLPPTKRLAGAALGVLAGGALGNLVDRVRQGYVVDFVHAHLGGRYHWPTFNVADVALVAGIGLYALSELRDPPRATEGA